MSHFKTAISYLRRSPFQALSAVFVLTITFFVISLLAILVYSSQNVINYFQTRPQIIAFLKDGVQNEEVASLQNKISQNPMVKEVRYVSKEEALEIYKRATADNPLLAELVSPSIFPASLEFSLNDLSKAEEIINELKKQEIVDEVGFTATIGNESELGEVISRLKTIISYLRIGGGIFAGILLITSFLVLVFIIGLRLTTRKSEVEILDLLGAAPSFIKTPFLIEAIIYSMISVILGWGLNFILVIFLSPSLISYFGEIPVLPKDLLELILIFLLILVAEIFVGLLLAFLGVSIAVSRARPKR